ncbi:MAG: ATP-binding domain-containing protein [Clostridia bacterium]|nr:ATP-binding domain-containing protein [Clostridia bacterium]
MKQVEKNYIPKDDFCVKQYKIMDYKDINELFIDTYKMYNFSSRINEIEKNLTYELRRKSEDIIDDLKAKRSLSIQNLEGKERIKVYEEFEKEIKDIEKDYKKIIKNYLKQMPDKSCIDYYKDFLENYIDGFKDGSEIDEVIDYLKKSTLENLKKNEIAFEDLAPLMYIQYKISGVKEKARIKHVVIDEAQDYGEFQFDVLKTILNSNSMTILGDLAQGVHYYRGIENWKRFIDVEFENVDVTYTTLQKTYRTTKEIMNVANNVISKLPEYEKEFIVLGEPVIDRKNSINIQGQKDINELVDSINSRIDEYLRTGYKSIAIIAKDMEECKEIQKHINKVRDDVKLIQGKDSEYNAGISIVPSYLAKGLEFDCVIIANANDQKYVDNSLDTKLLYVTITRAMSKLDVFYVGRISKLLDGNI